MTEMIDVLVDRASVVWLPAMCERDASGNKGRPICGPTMLRPGSNKVSRRRWDQSADHPMIKTLVEIGTLKLNPSASEVASRTHAPDSINGISGLSITKAKPWIAKATDLDLLERWRNGETKGKARETVLTLIDERMEALAGSVDGS